jgi:hypothetical protein
MGCMVKSLPQRQDYRGPMPAPLARRVRLLLLAGATLLLLTGCVKLDVDLTVGSDDKVSGTYVIGIDKSLLQFTGQDGDALYDEITRDFDPTDVPAGATVSTEKYEDDTFVGARIKVENVPISEVNDVGAGATDAGSNDFTVTHEGDVYKFHATIDTSSDQASSISVPDSVTSSAEIRIKMTFPGEVTETNGNKDGSSVTWQPQLGQPAELTATAKDSGGGGSGGGGSNTWLIVLAIVLGLAVVAALLVFLLTRGRKGTPPPRVEEPVPTGPPPGLGTLAPPTPAAPPPPPGRPLPPPN